MSAPHEFVLATIPGSHADERLLVVLLSAFGSGNQLEIRQQSWAEGIGWFTQSSVAVNREQLPEFRSALGTAGLRAPQRRRTEEAEVRAFPLVVQAESA